MGILMREVAMLYGAFSSGAPSPLAELTIQYADFAHWQRQWLQGEVLDEHVQYWKRQLAGAPPLLELPADFPRPAVQTFRGATLKFSLPGELSGALRRLSEQEGTTPFMTLLAAFQAFLSRYSGQEDIVVGAPIANRNRAEIESLIGFFVNILVLRADLSGNPPFRQLLRQVREVCLGAFAHQDLPCEKLVEVLHPERNMSHMPLVQVGFSLQNANFQELVTPNLAIRPLDLSAKMVKNDLALHLWETESGLGGIFEYTTDLFEATSIARMAEHFQALLEAIATDPDCRLGDLPWSTTRGAERPEPDLERGIL
jgi:non-ribosomal peptide synthetase component F